MRIKKRNDHVQRQLSTRRKLKSDINGAKTSKEKHELEDQLQKLEERISEDCNDKHFDTIQQQIQSITNINGTTDNGKVWKLRKKIFPKPVEHLAGKKDKKAT